MICYKCGVNAKIHLAETGACIAKTKEFIRFLSKGNIYFFLSCPVCRSTTGSSYSWDDALQRWENLMESRFGKALLIETHAKKIFNTPYIEVKEIGKGRFEISFESKSIPNEMTYLTFNHLEKLSMVLGTKNINIKRIETGAVSCSNGTCAGTAVNDAVLEVWW